MRYLLPLSITLAFEKNPDKEAVRYAGKGLTYAELEQHANSLAHTLLELGLRRGDRVGIFMNKSLESAVAMYGIMKAGGAYVPLDPFAPAARIGFVINDCGIRHVITSHGKLDAIHQILAQGSCLEHLIGVPLQPEIPLNCLEWEQVYQAPDHTPALNLTEQDLAYILYTSGSTGTPKGIMHTHRSGLSFAEWAATEYGLTSDDRLSNHAPLHFDLSTFDFFAGAVAGATTVIVPEALTKFPANMARFIEEEKISVWYSVPFALIQLMQRGGLEKRDFSALRWILFAGEVFPTKHLRQLLGMLPAIQFSNLYGPTETNVCTYYHVGQLPEDSDETIPIGKPCANIEDLVVDLDDRPVAAGEVGELLIRGGVVMKGYWGQPEKTRNGFYRRPAFDQFEDIFYRTGDLVQLDAEGNYRYLGRKDRQIKTRGYRVELDEIEVALLSHSSVEEAAAYPIPDGQGSNLIESAIIPKAGTILTEEELVSHISDRLPPYAIPVRIDFLMNFPRTSTGKINRRELQEMAAARSSAAG
ncbi:MAG TPA: amino acid adenylation domain-containing protein [Anaerolineales bacterium]|nr:amino acid adenylation domain-containing protein [Anaerolineales bacterium]